MTKYSRLNIEVTDDDDIVAPVFTHEVGEHGDIVKNEGIAQNWDYISLLPYKNHDMYQFLVWDNNKTSFFILLGKEKGNQF